MYVSFLGVVVASSPFSEDRSPKLKLSSMSLYLPYAKKRYMYPPEDNPMYMRKNGRCLLYYLLRDKDYLGT